MGKIAFLDIDGTIRAFDGTIPDSAIEAIHEARRRGHQVCISSGRALDQIEKRIIDIGFDGIISGTGSYVAYEGKCIRHEYFPKALFLEMTETLIKNGCILQFQSHDKTCILESQIDSFIRLGEDLQRMLGEGAAALAEPPETAARAEDLGKMEKILYFSDDFSNEQVKALWGDQLYIVPLSFPNPRKWGGELSPVTVNKAEGIKSILKLSGHSTEDVVAVGDSNNDIEMIAMAGLGIAMGNGTEGVKAAADAVTDTLENDGLYKAFKMAGMIG